MTNEKVAAPDIVFGMIGYHRGGGLFLKDDVDKDGAEKVAIEQDLSEYLLIPKWSPGNHAARKLKPDGSYGVTSTRRFVFRHLLDRRWKHIPSTDELRRL